MASENKGPTYNKAEAEDDELLLESGRNLNRNHLHNSSQTNHYNYFSSIIVKITVSFVVIALICLILNQTAYNPTQLLQKSYDPLDHNSKDDSMSRTPLPSKANDDNNLESVLKSASMDGDHNRTVIITTLNAAWTEPNSLFDLFLESFKIGYETEHLLKHLVVVAFDEKAYSRCMNAHLHCYRLTTQGVDFSGEAHFMSEDYLKMMWRRIDFLRTVLELGYNFVFTDADVMWLRDPFQGFYPDGDFQIACDHYFYNDSTDLDNSPNGGFNYVKSNNRTIAFYKFWHVGKDYFPGKHDQDVLNFIKKNPIVTKEIGLEMRFFDTAYFGGFCEPSKDLDFVITMHANCCIGIEAKVHDIKMVISDWKNYTTTPVEERNNNTRSWTVPRLCY